MRCFVCEDRKALCKCISFTVYCITNHTERTVIQYLKEGNVPKACVRRKLLLKRLGGAKFRVDSSSKGLCYIKSSSETKIKIMDYGCLAKNNTYSHVAKLLLGAVYLLRSAFSASEKQKNVLNIR